MFECIVYATDGSELAGKALIYAKDMAQTYKAKLYIVHAYEGFTDLVGFTEYDSIIGHRIAQGQEILDQAAAELAGTGIDVSTELLEGPLAEAIIRVAKIRNANLIVLGARGRSRLQGLLLGSTSQRVIHHAPCPVLVVR